MARVRAPELTGRGGWIGADQPLTMAALAGKVVVVVFWTSSNVSSARVIDELRPVERRFADELVVVGVHSPKFHHEQDHDVVLEAVTRLRVDHPVLDDPDSTTWTEFGVKAWPTVVVVDPEGFVVGSIAGEGCGPVVEQAVDATAAAARQAGTLRPRPRPFQLPRVLFGFLASPMGVAVSPAGDRLAIADTGRDRVLVTTLDGVVEQTVTGLHRPEAVAFEPDRDALLICDTAADRVVRIARLVGEIDARDAEVVLDGIASPAAVLVHDHAATVAESGRHHLWRLDPDGSHRLVAGDGGLGLDDGRALSVPLAQPSGLARSPQGTLVVCADTSSLHVLIDAGDLVTLVGRGLFDWGAADGPSSTARLQRPMGVVAAPDGLSAYLADTGNGAIRLWSGVDGELRTVPAAGLGRPYDVALLPDGRLLVADADAHRVVVVDVAAGSVTPLDVRLPVAPGTVERGGALSLTYHLDLGDVGASGLDDGDGPPVSVTVTAAPGWLLAPGPRTWALDTPMGTIGVRAGQTAGEGTVTVSATASVCGDASCSEVRTATEQPLVVV